MPFHQSMQQNLNQIAQICQQLSQNEQRNVSMLQQMQQMERSASQQLQQVVQLCNQVSSQMGQVSGGQFSTTGQFGANIGTGTQNYGNWSNIPLNTSNAFQSGQFGSFETSGELAPTGQAAFNTNKDLGK